jgi:hypothetical protein
LIGAYKVATDKRIKIGGDPSPHKRYRVSRDGEPEEVLGSFDSLNEAVAYVARLRKDRHYIVRDHGRKIVWPEKRRTP